MFLIGWFLTYRPRLSRAGGERRVESENMFTANPKYHNRKVTVDGIAFDSVKEARRWIELCLAEKAGEIAGLERQKKFVLIPAQYEETEAVYQKGGRKGQKKPGRLLEREVSYTADFVYTDVKTGVYVVEDTKGVRTKDYILKRKMMLYFHGIRIEEV